MPVSSAAISQVMAGELMLETSHHLPHSNITDWTCQWHFYRIWMERRLSLFLLVSQNPMISGVIVVWQVWHFLMSLSLSLYLLVLHWFIQWLNIAAKQGWTASGFGNVPMWIGVKSVPSSVGTAYIFPKQWLTHSIHIIVWGNQISKEDFHLHRTAGPLCPA